MPLSVFTSCQIGSKSSILYDDEAKIYRTKNKHKQNRPLKSVGLIFIPVKQFICGNNINNQKRVIIKKIMKQKYIGQKINTSKIVL